MRNTRAFTLIELLVVVGIIAVVAGLLLVTGRAIWEQSYSVRCATNLSGIGKAMHNYAADHNGFLPPGFPQSGDFAFRGKTLLPGAVAQFLCPADANHPDGDDVSYMINELTFSKGGALRRLRLDQVVNPGATVYAMDWWSRNDESPFTRSKLDWSVDCWPHFKHMWTKYMDVHKGGCNVLFIDGHVERFLKPGKDVVVDNGGQTMVANDRWDKRPSTAGFAPKMSPD